MKEGREFRKLTKLLSVERKDLFGILLFSIAVSLLSLGVPLAVQAIVNSIALGSLPQQLLVLAIAVFGILSFSSLFRMLQVFAVERIQRRIFARLAFHLMERLPRMREMRHILQSRANAFLEISTVQSSLATALVGTVGSFFHIVVGLVLLSFYHPILLSFALAILVIGAVALFGLAHRGIRTAWSECKAKYALLDWIEDVARSPELFASSAGQKLAFSKGSQAVDTWIGARSSHFRVWFSQNVSIAILQVIAGTALLGLGGWLVMRGELTLGQLVAAELVMSTALAGLANIGKHLGSFYDLLASTAKIFSIFEGEQQGSGAERFNQEASAGPFALELCHIRLAGHGSKNVLHDVDLHVAPGEMVSILGDRGTGKTLLAEIVMGDLEPDSGKVIIHGQHLNDLDSCSVKEAIGLFRDGILFHGSLAENVRLGNSDITSQQIREHFELVGLSPLLARLPEGLKTQVVPFDPRISKREHSLIGVCRALLSDARLIIIDQLLDGVDERSIPAVLSAIHAKSRIATVLILTQKERIALSSDVAFVLQQGALLPVEERVLEPTLPLEASKLKHVEGNPLL